MHVIFYNVPGNPNMNTTDSVIPLTFFDPFVTCLRYCVSSQRLITRPFNSLQYLPAIFNVLVYNELFDDLKSPMLTIRFQQVKRAVHIDDVASPIQIMGLNIYFGNGYLYSYMTGSFSVIEIVLEKLCPV